MTNGYNYNCINLGLGEFLITWNWDIDYNDKGYIVKKVERRTDAAGADRFCRKAGINFPIDVS